MAQFAQPEDLENRLGMDFNDDDHIRAASLLEMASGLVQDAACQRIELVEDDELSMPGTNSDRITLPERPVVSIASITIDGRELTEDTDWYLKGDTIYRFTSRWVGDWCGRGFGWPRQPIVITYTHGYAEHDVPSLVKTITLEAVQRVWDNPGGLIAERVGDTEVTFSSYNSPPQGLMLTDREERKLRRFFGQRGMSVMVG